MASYNTSCPNLPDLDGSCEITGADCTSYTSDNLGSATKITNSGSGSNLDFKVEFTQGPTPPGNKIKFKIHATLSGSEYDGGAKEDDDDREVDDPWVATATGEPAVAAKAY